MDDEVRIAASTLHDEPLVSCIKMTKRKKGEGQDYMCGRGKEKKIAGDVDEEETGSRKYMRSPKKGQYRLLEKKRREMT